MKTAQFEIVLCLKDLPRSSNVGDKTEFKFAFMDAVTTNPIPAELLKISRDRMLHSSIELTACYRLTVPEDYTNNFYSLHQFAGMMEGAGAWEGEERIGYVFSICELVKLHDPIDRLTSGIREEMISKLDGVFEEFGFYKMSEEEMMYESRREEIAKARNECNERYKKLLRDQKRFNVVYPIIAGPLAVLMLFSAMNHLWGHLLTQIPIAFVLWIAFRMGQHNVKTLEEKIW